MQRNRLVTHLIDDNYPLDHPAPPVRDKIRDLIQRARKMKVTCSSPSKSLVSADPTIPDCIVDAEKKTCTCHEWQNRKIPCVHACAHFLERDIDPMTCIPECLSMDGYGKTYSKFFEPVLLSNIPIDQNVDPPPIKRARGRPPKVRVFSRGEVSVGKQKQIHRCGKCGEEGHNRRKCRKV
jgi:hypothetical protein